MQGNTILITGATAGIGFQLTKKLLDLGNTVIGLARNIKPLDELHYPATLFTIPCDLGDRMQLSDALQQLKKEHPMLNVIINNAGIQNNYSLLEKAAGLTLFENEIYVNLTAPIVLTSSLLPLLIAKPEAAIVNITTGLIHAPKKSAPTYCASKAGLHVYTQTLRYQLENTAIRVIEVQPPLVDTHMTAGREKNKMSAEQVATEIINGIKKDKREIVIGKVELLKSIKRISPSLAFRIMQNR